MKTASFNETKNRQNELRHLFLPTGYGLVCESVIAVLALIVLNASSLSGQWLSRNLDTVNPLPIWSQLVRQVLDSAGQHYLVQQAILFGLWAIVGVLIYILIFRVIQIIFGVKHSVGQGLRYIRQYPEGGAYRWLASLHDFFIRTLFVILGIAALATGSLICFGVASQELNNALTTGFFPTNAGLLALSLVAAVLSVRVVVLGISLLSSRFRNWYTI